MYTLKSIVQRSALFGASFALLAAVIVPAASVFAKDLNPLTERSLLLSSSAPGFQDTDGSGYSYANPNSEGGNYAPAGSGPNGKKTGQTFSFRVSTDSVATSTPIKAFTLQYCTGAAGNCRAPGNNLEGETNAVAHPLGRSDLDVNIENAVAGTDFEIWMDDENVSAGWTFAAINKEDTHTQYLTGKRNFITLTHATGISPVFDEQIRIVFKASETKYITNPGDDAFFVKMNTYDSDQTVDHVPGGDSNIDGGVTVANVMTDSIHITTKVLETMSFSVGVQNRDTVDVTNGGDEPTAVHGTCDPIQTVDNNRLNLGNPDAEYSLETGRTWDVHSYWRLQSNSSGGATVYYSGNTLANTVGDEIEHIGATAQSSTQGTEQFGLAFVDAAEDTFDQPFLDLIAAQPTRYFTPSLTRDSLAPGAQYANGTGSINPISVDPTDTGSPASFAFEKESNTVPRVIASNTGNVISCATAKMRYIANIGADTPAGVYTTKINYLAAPQY